jgi:hypothetical protein
MSIKSLIMVVSAVLYFSPLIAVADDTKMCNTTQQGKCAGFCQAHQGVKSCIVDITTRSGTCNCVDGASHTKS